LIENYDFYVWGPFTVNTYFRLLIPMMCKNYNKVLYLDSDIVCNTDVANLFEIDLDDNYLAAVKDTHVLSYCNGLRPEFISYNKDVIGLTDIFDYYQMGVAIFNIPKILKDFKPEYFVETASTLQCKCLDQDVLNKICKGKIKELPLNWNVMIANKLPFVDEYYLPERYRQEYYQARLNPYIVHYCGGLCFKYPVFPDMGMYFWKYARKSPFYEEIIKIKYDNFYNFKAWSESVLYDVVNYHKILLKYYRYKILTFFLRGKYRNHYLQKRNNIKEKIRKIRKIIKKK